MPAKPSCYGGMFPDLDRVEPNVPARGRVFTVSLRSAGIGLQSRTVEADLARWDACQACPDYRSCYDLSMARLALAQALRGLE